MPFQPEPIMNIPPASPDPTLRDETTEPAQSSNSPNTPLSEVWSHLPSSNRSRAVSLLLRMAYQFFDTFTNDPSSHNDDACSSAQENTEVAPDIRPPTE